MTAPAPSGRPLWRFLVRFIVLALLWLGLVAWLGYLLYSGAHGTREADAADIREWLDETRVFRKSLPELAGEYLEAADAGDPQRYAIKHDEVSEQLRAMAEPTRVYSGKLPLFPEVYEIALELPGRAPPPGRNEHPAWNSPVPRPGRSTESWVRALRYTPPGGRAIAIRCEYRVHNLHRFEQEQKNLRYTQVLIVGLLIVATGVVGFGAYRAWRQEQRQAKAEVATERAKAEAERARAEVEHQERELADAERAKTDLLNKLLEAEHATLEMKSQLYASIGIMAGSYAHNIKNLLVRPNDLLTRCMEVDGLGVDQQGMLKEVKSTLATVTERLQQILRTVRRDPNRAELTRLDLNDLIRESQRTWADMAWEKWKLKLTADLAPGKLDVRGDLSHLQQAIENLVFNARDATFEMRNHLREEARRGAGDDAAARRQKLIEAAAWKGEVRVTTRRDGDDAVLEVRDNGIGMTEEVRKNCLNTHFTTKRDNALYEGYSAGMGLGLSFVAVVLDHHGAKLEIESAPVRGSLFRVRLPQVA